MPFEAKAGTVARLVAGRLVSIECEDAVSWRALGHGLGFDPALSWAVTPFQWDSELAGPAPDQAAHFSPWAGRFGVSFWLDPSDHTADCIALQIDARLAVSLGADEELARSMAQEYWTDLHLPRIGQYRSADCQDGHSLDLFPSDAGCPTPSAYPSDLDTALCALEREIREEGASP